MKSKLVTIATTIALVIAGVGAPIVAMSPANVFAADGSEADNDSKTTKRPEAAILTGCAEKGGEESIMCILNLAVDILSIGVGIFGVIGISVSGIQYLTAGGNEEKTRKAKRRLFEIVIGLAAYVVIYSLLRWLLPSLR